MRDLFRRLTVLIGVLLLTACVSSSVAGPGMRDVVLRFDEPGALAAWHVEGGDWSVADGRLVGRSLDPSGSVTNEHATYGTWFGDIERVIVRGGLAEGSPDNFRLAVGAVMQIFNWEVRDGCWFNYGRLESFVPRDVIWPGYEHEIIVESVDGRVRVVVDNRILWERDGVLRGAVTLHPCFGSTLWVREIVIRGRAVPWVVVEGPGQPIL